MGRIIYSDGRTGLTTAAFRYKLTDCRMLGLYGGN